MYWFLFVRKEKLNAKKGITFSKESCWHFNKHCKLSCKSRHRRCSVKKDVLKNFAIFTGKLLCWDLFLKKLKKKRRQHRCFHENINKILRTPILKKNLWTTASDPDICLIYAYFSNEFQPQSSLCLSKERTRREKIIWILEFSPGKRKKLSELNFMLASFFIYNDTEVLNLQVST